MSKRKMIQVLQLVTFVCVVNWFAWVFISIYLGGDAFHGKEEDGRYYLANGGDYTRVSKDVFRYSEIHGYTCFGSVPVILFAIVAISVLGKEDGKSRKPAASS